MSAYDPKRRCRTESISTICLSVRLPMSIAFSKVPSLVSCRCRPQPSSNWLSTARPPKRSASTCHQRCSHAPTKCSNESGIIILEREDDHGGAQDSDNCMRFEPTSNDRRSGCTHRGAVHHPLWLCTTPHSQCRGNPAVIRSQCAVWRQLP